LRAGHVSSAAVYECAAILNRRQPHTITGKGLGAFFPLVQIFMLFRGQHIDLNTQCFQLQAGDFVIDFLGDGVDVGGLGMV